MRRDRLSGVLQVDPAQLNQNNTATLRYVMPPQPVNVTVRPRPGLAGVDVARRLMAPLERTALLRWLYEEVCHTHRRRSSHVRLQVSYSIDWGNGQLTPQAPVNVSLPATSTPYAVSNASVPFTPALARDGLVLVGPSSPRASIRFTLRSSYPATTTYVLPADPSASKTAWRPPTLQMWAPCLAVLVPTAARHSASRRRTCRPC